jgi:PAS domain S-box-containing protein
MPTSAPASLADLAATLGESLLAWEAGTSTLRIFGGPALRLPAEPAAAGQALLGGLDEDGRARLLALLGDPAAGEAELLQRPPGGEPAWLQVWLSAGDPARRLGRVTVVTGRRQLERALRIQHERSAAHTGQAYLEAVVQSVTEALGVSIALVGRLTGADPPVVHTEALWMDGQLCANIDYPLAGTPCEVVLEARPCLFATGVARRFPLDPMLTDLSIESYLGVPVVAADGRVVGILAALNRRPMSASEEVTRLLSLFGAGVAAELDRLLAERRLQESEARFRQIVTCCAEGVALLDREGRILYANPQLAALVGERTADALGGRSFREYLVVEEQEALVARREQRRPGQVDRYEARLVHRDGHEVLTEVSAAAVTGTDGRVAGSIALFRDITEQRALDEQVREAQKLESLGRLAGGVAHDFNNLLVGILGNSSYAAGELPAGSDARAAVEDVHAAAQKASELTRQLLAYSGRGTFTIGPVQLDRIVEEMARLARPAIPKTVSLGLSLAGGLPEVDADAGQLGQLVVNLLTNAADALAGSRGTITLRTGLLEADRPLLARFHCAEGLPEGPYLKLEVEDDGPGMDEATRQRIFEPFFSTKFAGRGLGLAAALGIVKSHRGVIRVESEPGRGSRFTVLLPPGRVAVAARAAGRAAAPPLGDLVVLVADDEAVVRRTARRALERAGVKVLEAADGHEAVAAFRAHAGRVSCVLLDLTMPGLGGEEALTAIRELRPDVPVVLTSGWADRDEAPVAGGQPGVRFLPKPFGPSEMVAAVRAATLGQG